MKKHQKKSLFYTIKKSPFEAVLIAFSLVVLVYASVPAHVFAHEQDRSTMEEISLQWQIESMFNASKPFGQLPKNELRGPAYALENIPVTAYNSVPWQTDASPCVGAQGTDLCALRAQGSDSCAANFLPLGTVIEVEGLGTCTVRDRMNARYYYRVDWYMGGIDEVPAAKAWGVKYKTVSVFAS